MLPLSRSRIGALALFPALAIGCASPLNTDPYGDWVERDPASWRIDAAAAEHVAATLRPEVIADDELPAGVEALVALALERNPGLHAARRRVEALRERRAQVSAFDDPMLTVTPLGEMAETATGRVDLMAGVSQKLPFPGKRDAKGDAADAAADAAEADLAARRLEVAALVRKAYWSHAYAHQAVAVVNDDRVLRAQLHDSAAARYRSGTASQADVLRAGVELSALDQQLLELWQQATTAAAMLNRLLDRPADAPLPTPPPAGLSGDPAADHAAHPASLTLDRLLARAADHPRLAALRDRLAAGRERRRLARLERYPDLTVGLNYAAVETRGRSPVANGDDQWSLSLGINLPLWQEKRSAAEREALAEIAEAAARLTEERNTLSFRITDAVARVAAGRDALALYRDHMLPDAAQAVEAAASGYRAGTTAFIALIDNARRLTALRLMELKAATDLQKDLADLEEAVGSSLERLTPREPRP